MKYLKPLLITALLFPMIGSAQSGSQREMSKREMIRAQKVAHLTTWMKLTPEEAEKFWPVYNQMDEELQAAKKERRQNQKQYRDSFKEMSEAELEKLLDQEFVGRQAELDIRKKYHTKFKDLIGVHKTARLYKSEREFNTQLVKGVRAKALGDRPRPIKPGAH